jgi:cob(I)alamin adenosyltransferase
MKIYTKTGDAGTTSLVGGTRISKADLKIETYGTVDELNSWIGLVRDQAINESTQVSGTQCSESNEDCFRY